MFVRGNEELVAEELGIEVGELEQLQFDEGEHVSEDGLIYYFYIAFKDGNPPGILAKIRGLEGGLVRFEPRLFSD